MSECRICKDEGWVCENHPDQAWGDGDGCCGGAGMPCEACNPCDRDHPPRWRKGTTEIWSLEKGWVH